MKELAPIATAATPARLRVMHGLAEAIEDKGYVATTIADIVRAAGVSKRTFYEHFEDKEACFLALYAELSQAVIAAMREASHDIPAWPHQVRAAVNAYVQALGARPALTRAVFLEVNAAGKRALPVRRQVHGKFADFLRDLVARGSDKTRHLTPSMALAVVGGVNELVLLTIESGRAARLSELSETATTLITAVATSQRSS